MQIIPTQRRLFWPTQLCPHHVVLLIQNKTLWANNQKEHVLIRPRDPWDGIPKNSFVDFEQEFLWHNSGIGIIITRTKLPVAWKRERERQRKHNAAAAEGKSACGLFVYL